MTDLKWPDDYLDCISYGPFFGEVGYVGDYPQPLEYPCNCCYCQCPFRSGDKVRMKRSFRRRMRWSGSRDHIREFGRCIGTVIGLTDYNNVDTDDPSWDSDKLGPEVDIRWEPSNLRYAYDPYDLEVVR